MPPLTIHKIFKMFNIVSIRDDAFLTILGSCRSRYHFDLFSHGHYSTLCHKNLDTKSLQSRKYLWLREMYLVVLKISL